MRSGTERRAMVDTNIWISGFLFQGNEMRTLLQLIGDDIEIIICPTIIAEIREVLNTKFNVPPWIVEEVSVLIASISKMSEGMISDGSMENDELIIRSAIQNHCEILITGDRELLEQNGRSGLKVLRSNDFLISIKHCHETADQGNGSSGGDQ